MTLAGGTLALLGSLIVLASFTPAYKRLELEATALAVGTFVIGAGTVITFLGTVRALATEGYGSSTILAVSALAIGLALVVVFGLAFVRLRKIAHEDQPEIDEHQTNPSQDNN